MTDNTTSNTGLFNTYTPVAGDRIGDSIIIAPLAEGGMARIFKVKNEALEVIRVVKLMKPSSTFDNDRFVTEARISANLNHPNIIQCYRFDKYKGRIPYIEMEYVDGVNLHRMIADHGRLPAAVAASILYYICKALGALHTCSYTLYNVKRFGIVHRDIKPSNILIANDGNVKLADFGIAKPTDLSIHTAEVEVVGSVYYLSPEQLRKETLDFRTDIYSLGCVAYEMITAQKAFGHTNIPDIAQAKINNRFAKKPLENCPPRLRKIITTCLNSDKTKRFESVEKLSADVDLLLRDLSVENPQQVINSFLVNPKRFTPPSAGRASRKPFFFSSAPAALCALATVAVLLGIAGIIVTAAFVKKKSPPTDHYAAPEMPVEPANNAGTIPADAMVVPNRAGDAPAFPPKTASSPAPPAGIPHSAPAPENDLAAAARAAFSRRDFDACLRLLASRDNVSDTLHLIYLGSLAETGGFVKLNDALRARAVNDGYYHYVSGRTAYHHKEYTAAIALFMKALTHRSFYGGLPVTAHYYLARARTAQYEKTPNLDNKNMMLHALERFIANYCADSGSVECREIHTLLDMHK